MAAAGTAVDGEVAGMVVDGAVAGTAVAAGTAVVPWAVAATVAGRVVDLVAVMVGVGTAETIRLGNLLSRFPCSPPLRCRAAKNSTLRCTATSWLGVLEKNQSLAGANLKTSALLSRTSGLFLRKSALS
jgi:hypothetical protein